MLRFATNTKMLDGRQNVAFDAYMLGGGDVILVAQTSGKRQHMLITRASSKNAYVIRKRPTRSHTSMF